MNAPYYQDDLVTLWHGDCIAVMRQLPDASVDAVVTDPPYGLEFMGKEWDAPWKVSGDVLSDPASVGGFQDGAGGNPYSRSRIRYGRDGNAMLGFQEWFTQVATEALRVLKPGGHLLAFGGTRTWHRLAVAIEDAGFEVRDSIAWMYGSGFPKSLNVSIAIDKAAGAMTHRGVRVSVAGNRTQGQDLPNASSVEAHNAITPAAQQWQGWGTALKPAFEPIVVARKPLIGTVAENVLAHGTGALNIDGCRIAGEVPQVTQGLSSAPSSWDHRTEPRQSQPHTAGRWPANVILDESQAAELDRQSGVQRDGVAVRRNGVKAGMYGPDLAIGSSDLGYGGEGGASRFFYTAKADSSERPRVNGVAHPTVKPLDLMRYLVRLVTPPGGTVLEPFAGSGTTLEACIVEGFSVIGIELTEDYLPLITQRISKPIEQVLL